MQLLPEEIKIHDNDLIILRKCLVKFRNAGMGKDDMLETLEKLRISCEPEIEDVLLELMDFVVGYCNPNLSVF